MRGNETVAESFGALDLEKFTIPMRGNEQVSGENREPATWDAVYDPHEG